MNASAPAAFNDPIVDILDRHLAACGDKQPWEVLRDMLSNYLRAGGKVKRATIDNFSEGRYYPAFTDAMKSADRGVTRLVIEGMARMSDDVAVADLLLDSMSGAYFPARLQQWKLAKKSGLTPADRAREYFWRCALHDDKGNAFQVLKELEWMPSPDRAQDMLDRITTNDPAFQLRTDEASHQALRTRAILDLSLIAVGRPKASLATPSVHGL